MPSGRSVSNSPTRVSRRSRSRSPIRRRSRSRSPRRDRGGRGKGGGRDVRGKECRVYVSNLNYDVKWMELKDVMKKLGAVEHVEIFTDGSGRSKGCGVVEYTHSEDAARAIKELNGFEVLGRKVRLREDVMENDQYLEQLKQQKEKSRRDRDAAMNKNMGPSNVGGMSSMGSGVGGMGMSSLGGGLSGLSGPAQLIQLLNSKGGDPMNSSVFISNLDYDISWQKLKDMFRRAGNCIRCDIAQDDDKRSKGFGTVQFETPFEALSAIALFNGMELGVKRRQMSVRLDRKSALHQVLEQLGVPSGEVTQKTLTQIQSIATLAALSTTGALGGALSQLSALASGNPYQGLQSQSAAGGSSALAGLSGLTGLTSALGGLGSLLAGAGAGGGLSSSLSSLGGGGGSSGGYGGNYGAGYGSQSTSYGGSSQISSYGQSSQSNRRSDSGGNYGSSRSGGGVGGDRGGGVPGAKVFVRNLPFSVKWQDLKDKFREAGRIVRADIKTNDDGRSKGCGTVTFESPDDANRAVSLFNQSRMEGRELEVRIDTMN